MGLGHDLAIRIFSLKYSETTGSCLPMYLSLYIETNCLALATRVLGAQMRAT
jgi:hypothetical protein